MFSKVRPFSTSGCVSSNEISSRLLDYIRGEGDIKHEEKSEKKDKVSDVGKTGRSVVISF